MLTNEWLAPDGYNVSRMLINGTYPGPLIEADWGDMLNITVVNELSNHNGTSIHWHGIRQLNTTWEDGFAGVTQCPVPPGQRYVYTWRATQYGVSWYHSHFSLQYPDGLVGPLKINGPTSMNYDHDLGPVLVTDWLHKDAFSLFQLELLGRPPTPDSNLLNGRGPYYCCPDLDDQCTGKVHFTEFNFTKGSSYKMSLVNTAVSTHFTFWIDSHDFYVVATDFVPIKPYLAHTLNIAIGQRYDVVIVAKNETEAMSSTNYWIHARDCNNIGQRSGLGIIRYDTGNKDFPVSAPPDRLCYGCMDEESKNLHPVIRRQVGNSSNEYGKDKSLEVYLQGYPDTEDTNSVLHKWVLKDSSFYLDWREPSLSLITINGDKMDDPFPKAYVPVFLDQPRDSWVYFLIEGSFTQADQKIYKRQAPVAHPIHVHGHDFVILASGNRTYDPANVTLNLDNPPRRDVALLPVTGFLLIAFQINNPGTWLMHCHIAW